MCDIEIKRKDGLAVVTSNTEDGKRFLDNQYNDRNEVKLEDSRLDFFLEHISKIGLTSRFLML